MPNTQILKLTGGLIARDSDVILENISFEVNEGECVVLRGPNGSGKSTLLLALAGEKFLKAGELEFYGRPRNTLSNLELAKIRAVMLQADDAIDQLRVSDVLEIASGVQTPNDSISDFISAMVPAELRANQIGNLSVGQRAKVFLAASVIQGSKLILLDEPTAALDDAATEILAKFIADFVGLGNSILVATHDERISKIANRTFLITNEKLLEAS